MVELTSQGALPFVELRAHSAFSFGESTIPPEQLAARAHALGYDAIGLTDAADFGGVVRFVVACRDNGIQPVVGAELMVDGAPLALLVRNAEGYRNLSALVTRARSGRLTIWSRDDAGAAAGTPPRGVPRVTWRDVRERSAGLLLLTGPPSGRLARLVRRGQHGTARRLLETYRDVFGDDLAIEVQLHETSRAEAALAGALVALAEEVGIDWVVCNEPRALDEAGRRALDVLTALRHRCTIDEAADRGLLLPNDRWTLEAPDVVAARWAERTEGIAASRRIAARCGFELEFVRPPLPKIPVSRRKTLDTHLARLTLKGAHVRWGDTLSDKQRSQIRHELKIIRSLGFAGFFLVMRDIVAKAREWGILCQGRGSAANSAVTYCLGVTAIDPIKNGLLFERFLSEARVEGRTEAPDIDVDVEHDRREEVLDYVYRKYGRQHAAITCVTQQYSASTAVQDVCRAYGIDPELAGRLSKRVHRYEPAEGAERLRNGLAEEQGFTISTVRDAAMLQAIAAFEGLPRMRSTHPGGFVLSSAPIGDYCPVEPTMMGRTIIQYDKDDLDAVGIAKYDFLGLGALSVVRRAFDLIEKHEEYDGKRLAIYEIPLDDARTYDLIAAGDTLGTFQIESRAQIASLVQTLPSRIYDIVVQVALIRPGPIQAKFVHPYVERRRGRESVKYPEGLVERLTPILDRTQGIPIFQEQAMNLAMELGGYTATEADLLRRTMGNARKRARLEAALEELRARMIARGIAEDVARQLADDLSSFANYGFPESHAWSFAMIAYVTSWLKVHYTTAFYAAILNAQPMGFYSVGTLLHDARRHDVEIRLPCLALGADECTLETRPEHPRDPALRIGWQLVRGIGADAIERLTAARAHGPFESIVDVVRRAALTHAEASALSRGHAFARWEPERRRALWKALQAIGDVLPLAPGNARAQGETADDGYIPRPLNPHEHVIADYRALGCSTAGHPMERYRAWCRQVGARDSRELAEARSGERVIAAGLVTVRQQPQSAHGTLFLLLEDEHGHINVVVWKDLAERHREVVRHSTFLAVYGTLERDGSLINIIARDFKAIGEPEAEDSMPLGDGEVPTPRMSVLTHRSHDFH